MISKLNPVVFFLLTFISIVKRNVTNSNSLFKSKNPEVFNTSVKPAHSQKHERHDNNANHLISIPLTSPD